MTACIVSSGVVSSGLALGASDTLTILAGGSAVATADGGHEFVDAGGVDTGGRILSGGSVQVSSGGAAMDATVSGGGVESIASGGTITGAAVLSGGAILLSAGAHASGVTVAAQGQAYINQAIGAGQTLTAGPEAGEGLLSSTTILGGVTLAPDAYLVESFGIGSGGTLDIPAGGLVTDATVLAGGVLSGQGTLIGHGAEVWGLAEGVTVGGQGEYAYLLVNAGGDILYISGRTGRFLEPAAGKANWNIHVMLRPEIRAQILGAMRQALVERKPVELRGLQLDDGALGVIDVTVRSIHEPNVLDGMVMIVFREPAGPAPARPRRRRGAAGPAADAEVLRLREEIQALRQEMGASQEELQATNEELQSTNEELQSANEELTTSKEEAQSMNEELQTLNGELRTKLDDLALAQSDMQNLLNSTHIATLFLDQDLNVRRFTDQATRIVHLREVDIGRPLSELSSTLIYPDLGADVRETMRTLATSEKEVATNDDQWYSVRIMPYRTGSNVIQGVVITFVNITAAKNLESRLRNA